MRSISSSESRESKRKDVDGDEEDAEYTPQRRSKRHQAASRDHIDKSVVTKSKLTRRAPSPVHDSEERPIVKSVEHRGAGLPTTSKAKSKPPTKASTVGQKSAETTAIDTEPSIDDMLDETVEYIGTLERSRASPTQGEGNHAEESLPASTGGAQISPNIKIKQHGSYTDSASRRATLEKAAALRVAAWEAKSPASSIRPTVLVVNNRDHPSINPESMHTTDWQHNPPNENPRATNNRSGSQPFHYIQEQEREARRMHQGSPYDVSKQTNTPQDISNGAPTANERRESLPVQDPQKQTSPTQHRPTLKPQISYYVFAIPNGRLTLLQWPDGSLVGKTIDILFDEVASLTGLRDIKRCCVRCSASRC